MADALVAEIGDVEQAVDAAEVNERTIIGDVLDGAFDDLAFFQVQDQARTLLSARFFEDGAARHDDIAPAAIHLEDLERLRQVHQRADVAHGADIDLRTRKERHGAAQVDGEAALDAAKDDAFDARFLVEFFFQAVPGGFAAGAVAGQHGFAIGVFDAVDIDFDFVTDFDVGLLARHGEFAQRHAAFALQTDVDDCQVVFDRGDGALDDAAFKAAVRTTKRFIEHRGEIVARRKSRSGHRDIFLTSFVPAKRLVPLVLMADLSCSPDAMQNILRTRADGAGAKQKGRDEIVSSRPTPGCGRRLSMPRPAERPVGPGAYRAQTPQTQGGKPA